MADIDFLIDFAAKSLNKLQNLGLEGKINWALNVFTLGQIAQDTLVPIKRELFMCEDVAILVGSLEVWEHPQAHTLIEPPLGEPTYTWTSPTPSKPTTCALIGSIL